VTERPSSSPKALRVHVVELPARFGDVAYTTSLVGEVARTLGPDLVVLPELSLTGYVSPRGETDLSRFAEPLEGRTIEAARRIAREAGTALAVPLVLDEGHALFNATVLVGAEGEVRAVYRKRHPWFPERWATRGHEPHPVVELAGVRLTFATCYDVHFLADEAADALERADVLVFPSAWVDDEGTRIPLLQGLSRTFGVAVVNANWGRGEPRVPGQGDSVILDASGRIVARVAEPGGVASADLEARTRAR
jgi:predicted amidohydrolase